MTNDDWQAAMAELEAENAKLIDALDKIAVHLGPYSGPGAFWRQQIALHALGREKATDDVEWD